MEIINITDNELKLAKINKEKLLSKNFHFYSIRDEDECEIYSYRFPVYEYNGYIVLNCELLINIHSGDLAVNVYDRNNRLFAPFYHLEYGNYDRLLSVIKRNILIKLGELA